MSGGNANEMYTRLFRNDAKFNRTQAGTSAGSWQGSRQGLPALFAAADGSTGIPRRVMTPPRAQATQRHFYTRDYKPTFAANSWKRLEGKRLT